MSTRISRESVVGDMHLLRDGLAETSDDECVADEDKQCDTIRLLQGGYDNEGWNLLGFAKDDNDDEHNATLLIHRATVPSCESCDEGLSDEYESVSEVEWVCRQVPRQAKRQHRRHLRNNRHVVESENHYGDEEGDSSGRGNRNGKCGGNRNGFMPWRHEDSIITDPKPSAGTFDEMEVRRLSAFIVKFRDIPEGVLVLSGLICVWKSHTCDLVLRDCNKNVMGIYDLLFLSKRKVWMFRKNLITVMWRLFWAAAATSTEIVFLQKLEEIKMLNEKAHEWLVERSPNSWRRAYFELDRCSAAFENGQRALVSFSSGYREVELSRIPCVHGMAGYMHMKMNLDLGFDEWYSQCKCMAPPTTTPSSSNTMPPPPTPSSSNPMPPPPTPSNSNIMPPPATSSTTNTMPPPATPSISNTMPPPGSNTSVGFNTMPSHATSASTRTNKGNGPLILKKEADLTKLVLLETEVVLGVVQPPEVVFGVVIEVVLEVVQAKEVDVLTLCHDKV
nr:hypothetical protein CTI12_AA426570 [Tanacetum cinerariifolium]